MHCYCVLAETGRITGFLVAIQRVSMRPIRETKSQPRRMRGLRIASGRCARHKIYSQLRWTRPLPSGPWTCPSYPLRLRAARRLAATRGGSCVPRLLGACAAVPARLFDQVIFAPPRRIADPRAPRLGAFARRGSAALPRLRTLLPRVATQPRRSGASRSRNSLLGEDNGLEWSMKSIAKFAIGRRQWSMKSIAKFAIGSKWRGGGGAARV